MATQIDYDLFKLDVQLRLRQIGLLPLEDDGSLDARELDRLVMAYQSAYCDALTEDVRGMLYLEHGYTVPEPRSQDRRT